MAVNNKSYLVGVFPMQPQEGTDTIKIISSDNKEFVVEKKIAFMSELIKQLYDVTPETSQEIVVPDVTGDILGRVILFCCLLLSPMTQRLTPL